MLGTKTNDTLHYSASIVGKSFTVHAQIEIRLVFVIAWKLKALYIIINIYI